MRQYRLSVITPVLNEEFFLPLYLRAVTGYADEVLLLDGGSSDDSLSIITQFQHSSDCEIRYWQSLQNGLPYSSKWNEGQRRNFLLQEARGEWVLVLDADEFLSDNFPAIFQEQVLNDLATDVFGFCFIPFWQDSETVRVNAPGDPHWEGYIYRLIRKKEASYTQAGNHCQLLYRGNYACFCHKRVILQGVTLFHYHYALGRRLKENDNRRGDLGCRDNKLQPDWDFQPESYPIVTRKYSGEHPLVVRQYLEEGL